MKTLLLSLLLIMPLCGQIQQKGTFKIEKPLDVGMIVTLYENSPKRYVMPGDVVDKGNNQYKIVPDTNSRIGRVGGGGVGLPSSASHMIKVGSYFVANHSVNRINLNFTANYTKTRKFGQYRGVKYEIITISNFKVINK